MTQDLQADERADVQFEPFDMPTSPRLKGSLGTRYQRTWRTACVTFALQAGILIAWSRYLWNRFDLTSDFATFSQAWTQIGTGHLNPYETTYAYHYPHSGYPFWQSHFELIMWPLALLRAIGADSFSLLVVQDLALAGFGLVAFRFGLELLQKHWSDHIRGGAIVAAGLLVALLVSPWTYWTASFDFHFQPLAALFLALCARDLWNGNRRGWLWAAAVLLCGDVASSYLVGLGIAALLSGRSMRRTGLVLIGSGVLWILIIIAVGSGKGSSLAGNYGYLAHRGGSSGLAATISLGVGVVRHPSTLFSVLHGRWDQIYKFIASSGTLGVVSALGFGIGFVVLVPNALNQSGVFIGATGAFQNLVAVVFLTVGAVSVLMWIVPRSHGRLIAATLGCAALIQVVVMSAIWIPRIPSSFALVDAPAARQLSSIPQRIPDDAEVVASQGIVGRFGSHRFVYPFLDVFSNGQTIPIAAKSVAFVFASRQGIELASPAQTEAAISSVEHQPGEHTTIRSDDVALVLWHPPRGVHSITFPP